MSNFGDMLNQAQKILIDADNKIGFFLLNQDLKDAADTKDPKSKIYDELDINIKDKPYASILLTTNKPEGSQYKNATHCCRIDSDKTTLIYKEILNANLLAFKNNKTQLWSIWHIDHVIEDMTFNRSNIRLYITQKIKTGG